VAGASLPVYNQSDRLQPGDRATGELVAVKRLIAIFAACCVALVLIVVATGSGDDGSYRVRAIFNNAAFVIPGMDVKIAGVRVGAIESLDLTDDSKAAVVMNIENANYHDFRENAFCRIRPQSLIGERYIDCRPEEPLPAGMTQPALLQPISSGAGKGEYLLPSSRTATSVDIDLINNVMRLPFRERFTIILNEFGTALAGNGEELNAALKVTDPALKEFGDVLGILARQNKELGALAENGSKVVTSLASERTRISGFINSSGYTAEATAEESASFTENLQKFPGFLQQLRPTMNDLASFSRSATPVFTDLNRAADSINTFTLGSPAFNEAGIPALESLGDTADVGGPALVSSLPLVQKLGPLGANAKPAVTNLAALLNSLKKNGGIEQLMTAIYNTTGSMNGFDEYGHYVRARLTTTSCQSFRIKNDINCNANFVLGSGSSSASAAPRRGAGKASRPAAAAAPKLTAPAPAPTSPSSGAAAPRKPTKQPADPQSARALLDYLLGK
jgi:ABC-type transporter Mla subunit MlaD